MIAYFGLYLIVGVLSIAVLWLVHSVVAEIRGYRAFDYWDGAFPIIEKNLKPSKLLFNLLVWPVRFVQIAALLRIMYDEYQYMR